MTVVPTSAELQTALLQILGSSDPQIDRRLGRGRYYLVEQLAQRFEPDSKLSSRKFMEVVWSLIGQGLAYIDLRQSAPENWALYLTESGIAAAKDEAYNPDNPGGFLARLDSSVPDASSTVLMYAREAVLSYTARCYLSCAVMLGVASEAAFLEMALSFAGWLPDDRGKKFGEIIERKSTNFVAKFDEFRRRIEPEKPEIPSDLSDGMSLTLDAIADLLRINRNDAGHPTGRHIDRDEAFICLQMFGRYLQKLYTLKAFFDIPRSTQGS